MSTEFNPVIIESKVKNNMNFSNIALCNNTYSLELVKKDGGGIYLSGALARIYINKRYFDFFPDLRNYSYIAFHIQNILPREQRVSFRMHITGAGAREVSYVRLRKVYILQDDMQQELTPFYFDAEHFAYSWAFFILPALFAGWVVIPCTSYNISNFLHMSKDGCLELVESNSHLWGMGSGKYKPVIPHFLEFMIHDSGFEHKGNVLIDRIHFSNNFPPGKTEVPDCFPQPKTYPKELTEEEMKNIFYSPDNSAQFKLCPSQAGQSCNSVIIASKGRFLPARKGTIF